MTAPELLDLALSKLMLASVRLGDDMDRGLAERGLTRVRAIALWEIAEGGAVTQRELADRLRVTPRNVTALVDALEAAGFVQRTSHPSDRRARVLLLTRKGGAATARMKGEKVAMADILLGAIPEAKLRAFVDVLDEIVERLASEGEA
jgi:DNA-binding MarR family transcriptional regulator